MWRKKWGVNCSGVSSASFPRVSLLPNPVPLCSHSPWVTKLAHFPFRASVRLARLFSDSHVPVPGLCLIHRLPLSVSPPRPCFASATVSAVILIPRKRAEASGPFQQPGRRGGAAPCLESSVRSQGRRPARQTWVAEGASVRERLASRSTLSPHRPGRLVSLLHPCLRCLCFSRFRV